MGQHRKFKYYLVAGFPIFQISSDDGKSSDFVWFSIGQDWNHLWPDRGHPFHISGVQFF